MFATIPVGAGACRPRRRPLVRLERTTETNSPFASLFRSLATSLPKRRLRGNLLHRDLRLSRMPVQVELAPSLFVSA